MKKKWYSRLLLSYLPLFAISVLVLIVLFFVLLNEYARKEMERVNVVHAHHVRDTLDSTLTAIERSITREFLSNTKLQAYLESNVRSDSFQSYEAYRILSELVAVDDYIHSMYIYRRFDGQVLSNVMNMPLPEFGDRLFIEGYLDNGHAEGWTSPREYGAPEPVSVVSLVKRLPFGSSGIMGMLVVNVKTVEVQQLFAELSRTNLAHMHLAGADGQTIGGNMPESGHEFSIASKATGWEIRSGINRKSLPQLISSLSQTWLIMGTLFLGGCFVSLIMITRRNYRPVEYILDKIHSYSAKRGQLDDFQFIDSSIEELLRQTQEYKEKSRFDLVYKTRHYFLELLEGNVSTDTDSEYLELVSMGLLPKGTQAWVLILEMDGYNEFTRQYNVKDQNLLKFVLVSIVKEMAELHRVSVWQEWISSQQIAVILQGRETLREEAVLDYCRQLRQWVEKNISFTVTVALASPTDGVSGVHPSFQAALELMHYKAAIGSNQVIHDSLIKEPPNGELYDQLIRIRSMCHMFRLGKEEWSGEFTRICNQIQQRTYSCKELVSLMNYLIYHLNQEMSELPEAYMSIWSEAGAPRLYEALHDFETLEELRGRIFPSLKQVFDRINELRGSNSRYQTIQAVKAYITVKYGDPDLSLVQVSDAVHIPPVQLSRMFKEEFGEKFVDYMARVRVEQAKILLTETEESIQEVGKRIGYLHAFSFIRLFKKFVGETPGEYRRKIQESKLPKG